jgi:hypothetical protein
LSGTLLKERFLEYVTDENPRVRVAGEELPGFVTTTEPDAQKKEFGFSFVAMEFCSSDALASMPLLAVFASALGMDMPASEASDNAPVLI